MPRLHNGHWFLTVEGLEIHSTNDLADACERNEQERIVLVRELVDLLNWSQTPEACQIFRPDGTPNSLMLYIKRQIMFKCNRLLGNWNLHIDLSDVDMNTLILADEMSVEEASQHRHAHELDADRLSDIYVNAKREWSREFRSYMITDALYQTFVDGAPGAI